MTGWFAVKHGITDHPIFSGRPERLAAWLWMLDKTAWADTMQDVGGEIVMVRRGELCASQAMMERGTGLSRQQLRTFLDVLRKAGTVQTRPATKSTKGRTIVTICNYDKYQAAQPSGNQAATKDQPTKEQDNNIPVGTAEKSAVRDPAKIIFESGTVLLVEGGKTETQARSILGKWRKDYGDEALIAAIGRAKREGAIDPASFIGGIFRNHMAKQDGVQEAGAFGRLKEFG